MKTTAGSCTLGASAAQMWVVLCQLPCISSIRLTYQIRTIHRDPWAGVFVSVWYPARPDNCSEQHAVMSSLGQWLGWMKHNTGTVITSICVLLCFFYSTRHTTVGWHVTYCKVLYWAWTVILLDLVHDTWFYWTHRFLHWKPVYKHIHHMHHRYVSNLSPDWQNEYCFYDEDVAIVHHNFDYWIWFRSRAPSAFTGYSFHVIEALIVFANEILVCFMFPIHMGVHRLYHIATTIIHEGRKYCMSSNQTPAHLVLVQCDCWICWVTLWFVQGVMLAMR